MPPADERQLYLTRRELLSRGGMGLGAVALSALLQNDGLAVNPDPDDPLAATAPHFAPRAKHVIYLHMTGAPSQLDLFDYKPTLQEHTGRVCPERLLEGQRFAFIGKDPKLMGTKYKFRRHGESGMELSELLPHLATVADDIALIKTVHTEEFNHGPAQVFMHTGFGRSGRPSLGSWTIYGLGAPSENLPAYVVFVTGLTPGGGTSLWGSGFLPSVYQGIQFRGKGDPVLFVSDPQGIDRPARRRMLDRAQALNRRRLAEVGHPEIATRIASYEMAYRMQASVPELMDTASEPQHIHELYGTAPGKPGFATNCLLARRLVERGVRFVQLFDQGWDHHRGIFTGLPKKCWETDRAAAALVKDLKQRGMLDDTLVVFGGEFGRTPMVEGDLDRSAGRDHHTAAFAVWMAGGGVKGGVTVGRTDELGYYPVEDPIHVNDFHATFLHLLGLDHTHLTFKYQGRDFRLTDVGGNVIRKVLA